jgi:hypothetical protein
MQDHCRGCTSHNNAGHPKTVPMHLRKFNDWCCRIGKEASKAVGHCKLNNLKTVRGE